MAVAATRPNKHRHGMSMTVAEALARNLDRDPDGEAFVIGAGRLSWRQIGSWSDKLAGGLLAVGVARGDRVALFLPNSLEWIAAFFALAKIGAIAVPIHLRYKAPEIAHVLKGTCARLLICKVVHGDRDYGDTLIEAMASAQSPAVVVLDEGDTARIPRALSWSSLIAGSGAANLARIGTDLAAARDLLIIQYTSGTTGLPKGVELRHGQLLRAAEGIAARIGLDRGDRLFSPMPFFHIGGTAASLLTTLVAGATLCSLDRFTARQALDTLETEACTHLCAVEAMMVDILNQPEFPDRDLSRIRGGWTNRNVRAFEAYAGIANVYALSECSSAVAMCHWSDELARRRDTCGRPLDGIEVRIADPLTHRDLPADIPGLILVRGWCVTSGYFNDPEATKKVTLADGWFDTGDFGRLTEAGDLVYEGRLKDVLRVGGENVGSLEIEAVLNAHPQVVRSAVVPLPDPRLGQVPCAYVQLTEAAAVSEADLIVFCRERMASFKVPEQVLFVESFQMTETNKIVKAGLAEKAHAAVRRKAHRNDEPES